VLTRIVHGGRMKSKKENARMEGNPQRPIKKINAILMIQYYERKYH
jgi:hypothetical protein